MNFILDMHLRGFNVMGMNKAKIENMARVREARNKYKDFLKDYDVYNTIEEYFKQGQNAEVFLNDRNNQPLINPMDTLRMKFIKGNYTYLMMRVPNVVLEQQNAQRQAIINQQLNAQKQQQPMTPQQYRSFLRQFEIARAMPRPQRGKIHGKSKYLPKALKPPSPEVRKEKLEMCRDLFRDKPEELTIKTKYDNDD